MLVSLTGVVQTGEALAVGVPPNARATIRLPRGVDAIVRVAVITTAGAAVAIGIGDTLILTVKGDPRADAKTLSKSGAATVPAAPGSWDFVFAAADTVDLEPRNYVYDVWLTQGAARQPVIPASPFVLESTPGFK